MVRNLCFFDLGTLRRVKIAQDKRKNGPRASQDVPRASQERHKSAPRALQERSKTLQERKPWLSLVAQDGKWASVGGMLADQRRGGEASSHVGQTSVLGSHTPAKGAADDGKQPLRCLRVAVAKLKGGETGGMARERIPPSADLMAPRDL